MAVFHGTKLDDILNGTAGNDVFRLWQGGNDTVDGGGGNDAFKFGGTFTALDKVDGGTGKDTVVLKGDYSAPIVFASDTMVNVERLTLLGTSGYNLTTADETVAAGRWLSIRGQHIANTHGLTFDGSAETDGHFSIAGSQYNDTLTGGAQGDIFNLTLGGADTVQAGGGDDTIYIGPYLGLNNFVDGGTGFDFVRIDGDFYGSSGSPMPLSSAMFVSIEDLNIVGDHSYYFTAADNLVASGDTMIIDAGGIGNGVAVFDGSNEHDGAYVFIGGGTSSTFTGGDGNDTFNMYLTSTSNSDGGAGSDQFVFADVFTSGMVVQGGAGSDTLEFDAGTASLVIDGSHVRGIETVLLPDGHEFDGVSITGDLTSPDGITAGGTLTVDASTSFKVELDLTSATSTGYNILGGGGNDTFTFGTNLHATDTIDGGGGNDTLVFGGDFASITNPTISDTTITNVENITLLASTNMNAMTVDGDITGGAAGGLAVDLGGNTIKLVLNDATSASYHITGGATSSIYDFAGNFTAADTIDAGAGANETLVLQGDYSAGLTFGADTIKGIDTIAFFGSAGNDLTLNDGNVAAGETLMFRDNSADPNIAITINGSAETDGNFDFNLTKGTLDLTGGAGDDTFELSSKFDAADHIDGGAGNDTATLTLSTFGLTITNAMMANIETLVVNGGASASLTTSDGNVAAGKMLTVQDNTFGLALTFNGAAETDGSFHVIGNSAGDTFTGGSMGDTFTGNGGADTYLYTAASQSTSIHYDTITDFAAGTDKIDLNFALQGFGTLENASVSVVTFDQDILNAESGDDQIHSGWAHILHANAGDLTGHDFLVIDAGGNAQYQAGTDYVIDITGYTGTISAGDFV